MLWLFFFLSQVILFLFSFVTGMVMYANEDETKKITLDKKLITTYILKI